ncbi:MAG TPA: hypothetical protein VF268_12570 [Gammaproteobacteria bacterium]
MKKEIVNASGRTTEAESAVGSKPVLTVDAILASAAQLWLLTAFVTTIFWLPPF